MLAADVRWDEELLGAPADWATSELCRSDRLSEVFRADPRTGTGIRRSACCLPARFDRSSSRARSPVNRATRRRCQALRPGQGSIAGLELAAPNRPNGPAERSPGLRPKADALGRKATDRCGLKGRKRSFLVGVGSISPGSRDLSGRMAAGPVDSGHRP